MTAVDDYYQQQKEYYAERVDTPQPCEVGDTVEATAISGIPSWMTDYPVTGEVVRVEPRGVGTHNIFADWFIRVRFTEDQLDGAVYQGTTELYCVGMSRGDWDETPLTVVDD